MPDKAVDLLDTASARVCMSLDCEPQALRRLSALQVALELEGQALEQDQRLGGHSVDERLATIAAQHADLQRQHADLEQQYRQELDLAQQLIAARQAQPPQRDTCAQLQRQLSDIQGSQPLLSLDVDARSVAQVIADWTGVPLGKVLRDAAGGVLALADNLKTRIRGQDTAVEQIAEILKAAQSGLRDPQQPLGVFLLVGPSGSARPKPPWPWPNICSAANRR